MNNFQEFKSIFHTTLHFTMELGVSITLSACVKPKKKKKNLYNQLTYADVHRYT